MNIKPLHDRVLIKRIEQETKTKSGIIIPDTAQQDKPTEGEVIAVGSGIRDEKGNHIPMDVKPGDKVLFAKWGSNEIKVDGQEYLIMKQSDILAIVGNK
jgi:chaperonin GroES